ncbi:glycosyltransferase [Sphingobacterium prati]|uniref:glycosyltransferase n=1 Tax=Sphingobacterium prati TaxID=2737006 RepID=UPI001553C53C|nr:glycosyltransferase [Sphingobacterium prati]NPE45877.1 glycosyltransferase [Sphingobacterium prati]
MKIVLIITDYGSFNNFLSDLAIRLKEDGHEVSVITSETRVINIQDKFDYLAAGIKFFYVDFPRGFNPFAHYRSSKKIQKILDSIVPNIVHIHFTTGIFTTLFAGRVKYRTLGTFHGLGFPVLSGLKKQVFGAVEKFCFGRLDKIYVLNEVDYKAVKALGYKNVEKYETLGLGCDLSVFNPDNFSETWKASLREELDIGVNDFVFAYTGRFVNFKGYDKVIRSFLKLYSKNSKVKLLLIGGNDPIHPTGLTENETILMNNCEGIIHIGFTKDVASYLSITDVFVFPSVKEGMPVCVIEALAMGVPVITADSRGCNEIVQNDYNGYVVDVTDDNWSGVYEKMEQLIINKDYINQFKSNIQQDRNDYDRNRYVICEKSRYEQYSSIEK